MKSPTYQSVLRPDFPSPGSRYYLGSPMPKDYILVPRIELIGTFKVQDIISLEQLGRLAAFANSLDKKGKIRA